MNASDALRMSGKSEIAAAITHSDPISTRLNESAARSFRKPKSNMARKKCSVSRHSARSVKRFRQSAKYVVSGFSRTLGGRRTSGSLVMAA